MTQRSSIPRFICFPRGTSSLFSLEVLISLSASGFASFPLRPLPGGRHSAAARTAVSDGVGSRQTTPNTVWHSPRSHSRPATLLRPPFCPFHRSALFLPAAAQVKEETSRRRQKGKDDHIPFFRVRTSIRFDPQQVADWLELKMPARSIRNQPHKEAGLRARAF
jgi:hypothetical protein